MKTVHIIIAFCIGLFFGHILFTTDKYLSPQQNTVALNALRHEQKIDSAKIKQDSGFQKSNFLLKGKIEEINRLLATSKAELKKKQKEFLSLAQRLKTDTAFAMDSCNASGSFFKDSLSLAVSSLNQTTDSLSSEYEQKITLEQSMVAVRDSQIVICNQSYSGLKNLFDEQALREQQLTRDLNTALKTQKRKRLENKFLAAGILFISGVAASLIVKSRQ